MKKFEETLDKIEVPILKAEIFEHELQSQLINRYFNSTKRVYANLRWAVGFAVLFFAVALTLVIRPQFALKAHEITFRASAGSAVKPKTTMELIDCLKYTSIRNPSIRDDIDPEKYREDKAYVIRKYKSHENNDAVLIVSEFDAQHAQLAYNRTF
ncbi:MAG: hypothetical protein JW794_09725 [Candidatus Cloacimonetes bacterium]|nr:hypothetical protein [Candidatus Cloacimonadota bacterium]